MLGKANLVGYRFYTWTQRRNLKRKKMKRFKGFVWNNIHLHGKRKVLCEDVDSNRFLDWIEAAWGILNIGYLFPARGNWGRVKMQADKYFHGIFQCICA